MMISTALATVVAVATLPTYAIHGAGTQSCGTWTSSRSAHDILEAPLENWVEGFITGINFTRQIRGYSDLLAGTDQNGAFAWVDNYCSAHPLDNVSDATANLVTELTKRQRTDPPH
jgi:hypothetical protein